MEDSHTAVVLAGGGDPDPDLHLRLPAAGLVVAADGGLDHAAALGLSVNLVVGDLDSVDSAALEASVSSGAEVERHPIDKDATDLDLALGAARRAGARHIVVVGGVGGRLDHFISNLLMLSSSRFADLDIEWWSGRSRAIVVREVTTLTGSPGDTVTLLAAGGVARGVTTSGLQWRLVGDELEPGSTRGVSNVMTGEVATIRVGEGTLLAIHERMAT